MGDSNGFKGENKKDVSDMPALFADNPARRNDISRKAPDAKKGVKKANESDVSLTIGSSDGRTVLTLMYRSRRAMSRLRRR